MYKLLPIQLALLIFLASSVISILPIQATSFSTDKDFADFQACGCNQRHNRYRQPQHPAPKPIRPTI